MKSIRNRRSAWFLLGVALSAPPGQCWAHAFGDRYDLPLPLKYYLLGAGLVVVFSFIALAFVFRRSPQRRVDSGFDLLQIPLFRLLRSHGLSLVLKGAAIAGLALVVVTGLFGPQEVLQNFAPIFVWVIWWVGFAYFVMLIGNLWPLINPWSTLFRGWERWRNRHRTPTRSPDWLGVWPCVLGFYAFAWFELIPDSANEPRQLAWAVVGYTALTWLGMASLGRTAWLRHFDVFALVFRIWGRFSVVAPSTRGSDETPVWVARWPGQGLLVKQPEHGSVVVFVILMLCTVTFDGLRETPLWSRGLSWLAAKPVFQPVALMIHDWGFDLGQSIETLALLLAPVPGIALFMGACWISSRLVRGELSAGTIAGCFVLTLVPIAIAYHVAHYFSYLALTGQRIIPVVSDPFALGWDLFGTKDYEIDISVVSVKFVWYLALGAIVLGHVIAVIVAHLQALRLFDSVRLVLLSQLPFVVVMVAYTMSSLWILSQPLIETPGPRTLLKRSDELFLSPLEFQEYCVSLAQGERIAFFVQE